MMMTIVAKGRAFVALPFDGVLLDAGGDTVIFRLIWMSGFSVLYD
jgi:hypothetical protein